MNEFTVHRPTGVASWPMICLAGVEGGGKSWSAAEATGIEYFDLGLWLEFGEQMAEEYGAVPGANYGVIDHDGSYNQVLGACKWAARESRTGKPRVFVFDSISKLWEMLSDEQQIIANRRAAEKGRRTDGDANITVDQWNVAKDKFYDVIGALRGFNGPVILSARLDNVAVIGPGGTPTGEKIWKVRAQKDLVFECQVIMQARAPRQWTMTKIASSILTMPSEGYMDWPDFTIEELLIRLELDGDLRVVADRSFVKPEPAGNLDQATQQAHAASKPQASADDPRGDLPTLPTRDEWVAQVKELEANTDRDALIDMYKLAKAHGNRIFLAIAEGAGKRVKIVLDREQAAAEAALAATAGEESQEPTDVQNGEPLTAEEQADWDAIQAETERKHAEELASQTSAEPEPAQVDAPTPDPKEASGQSESSDDSPAETGTPEPTADVTQVEVDGTVVATTTKSDVTDPAPETAADDDAQPKFDPSPCDGFPHGRNKWSGEAVVDPQARANTPRRRGVLKALSDKFGDQLADAVFGELGLEVEEASTTRLQEVLQTAGV